jgi:hypothetical protein
MCRHLWLMLPAVVGVLRMRWCVLLVNAAKLVLCSILQL